MIRVKEVAVGTRLLILYLHMWFKLTRVSTQVNVAVCVVSQYRCKAADSLSQLSGSSASSRESVLLAAADVRRRLAAAEEHDGAHAFRNAKDPSAQALKVR